MAKRLVRYLLEGNGSIPLFVESGGYFPLNEELVGLSVDENIRHVPLSVARMSRADLLARITSMNPEDEEGNPLTEAQIEEMAQSFLDSIGLSDLV